MKNVSDSHGPLEPLFSNFPSGATKRLECPLLYGQKPKVMLSHVQSGINEQHIELIQKAAAAVSTDTETRHGSLYCPFTGNPFRF